MVGQSSIHTCLSVLLVLLGTGSSWIHCHNSRTSQAFSGGLWASIDDINKQDEPEINTIQTIPSLPKLIVTCATTDELVDAVSEYIQESHIVAEIGSQLREISTKICESCYQATLVDIKRKFPKSQKDSRRTEAMRMPQDGSFFPEKSTFHEIQHLSDWHRAIFPDNIGRESTIQYDILVLDVNAVVGNDLEWTSLQILQQFHAWNGNKNLIVLVKSSGLNQWANRIHHPKYWKEHQTDLWNLMKSPPFVVATVGVQEYRSTIPHTVRPTDTVLEVGCHYGTSTSLIYNQAAHCIGVDVGNKIIASAHKKHPHIEFRVGNAWKTGELLRFLDDYVKKNNLVDKVSHKYDVIYVDVGGLSGSDGLLESIQLIASLRFALEPRCIVIKSLCMQRLSSKLMCYWMLKKQRRDNHRGVMPE